MKVRILACIQAAILAFSSFQTTAATIPTDNSVLGIEAEAESETVTESDEELFSETETFYDMSERYFEEVDNETDEETLSEKEINTETETETEDVMVTAVETETEDVMVAAVETETETEIEDVTETDEETETKVEDVMETETKVNIDTAQYLTTVDAVGGQLRKSLTNREAEITVYYQTTEKPDDEIAEEIWDAALEHTGKPTEGDYIRFQYESYEIPNYEITTAVSTPTENGEISTETIYYLPITYKVTYYTTYEQELELNHEVEKVIDSFEFSEDTNDYQKIKTIYEYICKNDDNENLDDAENILKHTAYGALINKTAACQGYASLLYRLLLECDIDTRIISGTVNGENHVWNIVKYGDSYYYLDASLDAGKTSYGYFLKGSDNFSDHTAEAAYTSEKFTMTYPISKTDEVVDDADNGSENSEESKNGTEIEDNAATENGTEVGAGIEAGIEAQSDLTSRDGQERDERPSITESGVLFPGKKADGFSAVYTGEKICPTMIVTYTYQDNSGKSKTQTLKLNVDYTVTYRNNVDVGGEKATVTVKGIGEYQGTVTKEFDITPKSISKVTLSAVGDIKFDETPKVTVTDGTKELVEDIDYTIDWTKGNANTTTVSTLTVKAVESNSCNYTGTANKKATFNILGSDVGNAVSIADARVELKDSSKTYTYSGKAQKPAVVVKDKDGSIIASSNYKVIYNDNVNAGINTAEAYVVGVTKKGTGYYGISEPLKFTIAQKSFGKVSASIKGAIPMFGTISDIQSAINEAVVVKDGKTILSYGEDYTIDYGSISSSDNIDTSTKYEIKISPANKDGNYASDTKSLQIKFGQLNLASKTAVVSLTITNVDESKTALTYNGKTLEQDKDYTVVSIKQDRKTELYTVKIKAVKGSAYKGSLTFKGVAFKEEQSNAPSMTLDKDLITGETGETVQLSVVLPPDVQVGTITWESSNQNVATVTDAGLVQLMGNGSAVITARANASVGAEQFEMTAQCQVITEAFVDVTEYGAVPGDGKDDWEAFTAALSNGRTAYVPAGIYNINLAAHDGISMRKGNKLIMHEGAVLQAMKSGKEEGQVISVGSSGHLNDPDYYSNIEISGGTIIGELRESGKDGDGVMGIRVQYAKDIYIHDVTVKECRGDGIYVGGNGNASTNIRITNCTIQDNSRNCLGIVCVHNLYVDNCNISGAGNLFGGKAPRACILIEKNPKDDVCTNIVIKNSYIDNEAVCKKQSEAYAFGSSSARNEIHGDGLTVENCTFKGRVANYSTKNAKFINCSFNRDPIFKQDTVVQNE